MKTKEQIERALNKVDPGSPKYHGMTYEQGIEEALMWVLEELGDDEFTFSDENS